MSSSFSDLNEIAFASIAGIRLGHAQNMTGGTGCTVIVCEGGAVAGCDVRGGGPATHETDLLKPENMVQRIHGIVLAGGSAYGLEACAGVMASLESRDIGFNVGVGVVPIVCGAALFDLYCGDPKCRPDRAMGMSACEAAFQPPPQHIATTATASSTTTPFDLNVSLSGNKGAGTGAAIGKLCGIKYATKGGVGVYAVEVDGYTMGAVVAVNAVGDVVAPNGSILGGMRRSEETILLKEVKGEGQEDQTGVEGRGVFVNSEKYCLRSLSSPSKTFATKKASSCASPQMTTNTTIACLVTNAPLTKSECTKLAAVAHDAFARTIRPVHTNADGDSIFVLSTAGRREEEEGKNNAEDITVDSSPPSLPPANPVSLAVLATAVLAKAIIRAIESAEGAYGLPSATEMKRTR